MGSSLSDKVQIDISSLNSEQQKPIEVQKITNQRKEINCDVIEAANIAMAIKNKEHIINLQLTISLACLPPAKAFEEMNIFVVLFKNMQGQIMELGRTQIINNDLNPKYLETFILPSNTEKSDEIEFRIYNNKNASSLLLEDQAKIGYARQKLDILNDNELSELPVVLTDPNIKERTLFKITCNEYDGANLKYEIQIEVSGLAGKVFVNFVIEILKDSEWIPIGRSNKNRKKMKFDSLKIAANKFPGEYNTRIRIKLYNYESHEELGCTEQLTLTSLLNQEDKENHQRIYKNGFVVCLITFVKWKKINRDSFLTYIANGARLHLILGIDFTNSNFKNNNLHSDVEEENQYIAAIRQIVGMLQYFDYCNQIAIYGFGACLPPYYKCVGQCFALNGNYYHPLISGGVDQIIKLYRATLQKIKPHGPSKISQIVNMAISFAQAEYESSNYYVLIILTDGDIDDYDLTVEKIIEASSLPLSIVIVGLGEGNFTKISLLDQDKELLRSKCQQKVCQRDMVDFINFNEYLSVEKNAMTETKLARMTFSEIPKHFVDYMERKDIKPNKEKKNFKTAKSQFITDKIKENKNSAFITEMDFLKDEKRKMKRQLIALGFADDEILQRTLNMPINDLNYFIQLHANAQPPVSQPEEPFFEVVSSQQQRKFEERVKKNEQLINKRLQNQILKREMNQMGKRRLKLEKPADKVHKQHRQLKQACLSCKQNEICILYMNCGHLAVCQKCNSLRCVVCKQVNRSFLDIRHVEL